MAMASSRGRWASPERTMVWTEPKPRRESSAAAARRKVAVVYYLCRNGQLEHPHFMEVTLSSPDGLYLRDVMERLNLLRGKGMATLYSWSSKRSYKNGYVWHDLTEDDLIHPAHGNEYVLKGSELLLPLPPPSPRSRDASSSSSSSLEKPLGIPKPAREGRNKTWSSFDLGEYKVHKTDQLSAADAATQTDDRGGGGMRRRRPAVPAATAAEDADPTTELGIDEISPPPSSSSPETLETLIKNDVRVAAATAAAVGAQCEVAKHVTYSSMQAPDREVGVIAGGRMRASAVLMHLISCGSIAVKDSGVSGTSVHFTERLPRGRSDLSVKDMDGAMEASVCFSGMEREYFSGSLIETKKTSERDASAGAGAELPGLKRSSSYNADRSSKMELAEKEIDGVRAKCIPRKPRSAARREAANAPVSRSNLGSKRIVDESAQKSAYAN